MAIVSDLPLEIVALILKETSSIDTLLSAIQSSNCFQEGFILYQDKILSSFFEREWGKDRVWINSNNCGRLLLQLITVARIKIVKPALVKRLLQDVWPRFQQLFLEEILLPVYLATARLYIRNNQSEEAMNLLGQLWSEKFQHNWSIPAGIGRHPVDNDEYISAVKRTRVALYPLGKLLARLLSEAGHDTTNFLRRVEGLRYDFEKSAFVLIGTDRVVLYQGKDAPGLRNLLEDGIWLNTNTPAKSDNESCSEIDCVKAIVRVTMWSPQQYRILLHGHPSILSLMDFSSARQARWGLMFYTGTLPKDTKPIEDSCPSEDNSATIPNLERPIEYEKTKRTIDLICSGRRSPGPVTKEEADAAAGRYGVERTIVDLLIQQGNATKTDDEALLTALREFHLTLAIKLLREAGSAIQVTENTLKAGVASQKSWKYIVNFILHQRVTNVHVTEDVLKIAAGNQDGLAILKLLFELRGDEIHITKDVLETAVRNQHGGIAILKFLCEKGGHEIPIGDNLLAAVARSQQCEKAMIERLLDRRGDRLQVSEDIVRAAIKNGKGGKVILQLLLDRQDHIQFTGDALKIAAQGLRRWEKFDDIL